MEVLIAILLIGIAVPGIVAINLQSMATLRSSRQAAAASQVLQQRMEMIRDRNWSEVASSRAVAALLSTAASSEEEVTDPNFAEMLKVTVPTQSPDGPVESGQSFSVRRHRGGVSIVETGDFSGEHTLFFEGTVVWHDKTGVRQRVLRTIICRHGLTRSGVFGSVLGRPGTER